VRSTDLDGAAGQLAVSFDSRSYAHGEENFAQHGLVLMGTSPKLLLEKADC
jgi:hypothetical protein